jgi:hypothetical protein
LLRWGGLRLFHGDSGSGIGGLHAYYDMQIPGEKGGFAYRGGYAKFLQGVSQGAITQGTLRKAEKDEGKGGSSKK